VIQAGSGIKTDLNSKMTNTKRIGECGSSSRAPAQQAQGPEFNPQYFKKKKR
jgi:hypothetical protein